MREDDPMTTLTLQTTVRLDLVCCSQCGIEFGLPVAYKQERREDHATWYCPNGHPQYFPAESEAEKLRKRVANLEDDARVARLDADRAQREAARLKKRAQGGACPCCNRTFAQLTRHMKTKHPDFAS